MKQPSFSVCIPNYNYANYISQTIQSVLNQTYQNFEIIVADNASSDHSVKIIESFKDPRIRLLRNNYNIGFAPNLQRASMFAQNDFINLLSSDDLMKPNALEEYAKIIESQGQRATKTVLMSDVETIDSNNNITGLLARDPFTFDSITLNEVEVNKKNTFHRGKDVLKVTLKRLRTFAPFLSIVYPRVLWDAVEGYNCIRTIGPDKHFNYKLLSLDPDIVYIHQPLYQYRVHTTLNTQAGKHTIKQQIDDYLYTIEMSESFLESLGLTRLDLVNTLLDRVCLKTGLTELVSGSYSQAVSMLAFSIAAYPKETLHRPRAYALAGLLLLGPLSHLVARFLYRFPRSKSN